MNKLFLITLLFVFIFVGLGFSKETVSSVKRVVVVSSNVRSKSVIVVAKPVKKEPDQSESLIEEPRLIFGFSAGLGTNSFSSLHYPGIVPMSFELKMYHKGMDLGLLNFIIGKGADETSLSYDFSGSETSYTGGSWLLTTFGSSATISSGKLSSFGYKSRWYYFDRFEDGGFSLAIFSHIFGLMQSSNHSGFGGYDFGVDVGYHVYLGEGLSWDMYVSPIYSVISIGTVNGTMVGLDPAQSDFKVNLLSQLTFYL